MSPAERMRRSRARRANGRRVLRVEVDEVALEHVLQLHGYLSPMADDREKIEHALAALLHQLCDVTRNADRE